MSRREARMWPGVTVAVVLALLAFVISFDALRAVGLACGINEDLAWMFPIIIDGSTLAFTWAAWAFKTRRMGTVYPWLMLVLFSVISLVGNALHAHPVPVNGLVLPGWVPPIIMTVPPVALLATTHMIVLAAGRSLDRADEEAERRRVSDAAAAAPAPSAPSIPPAMGRHPIGMPMRDAPVRTSGPVPAAIPVKDAVADASASPAPARPAPTPADAPQTAQNGPLTPSPAEPAQPAPKPVEGPQKATDGPSKPVPAEPAPTGAKPSDAPPTAKAADTAATPAPARPDAGPLGARWARALADGSGDGLADLLLAE